MSALTQAEVLNALAGELQARSGPTQTEFRRVVVDSRVAERGDLFVALPGERVDGHAFVAEAAERGATGALIEHPVEGVPPGVALFQVPSTLRALQLLAAERRRSAAVRVVAVTGSVGKTTCKELVASVLGTRFRVHKNEANQNNEVGLPLTILAMDRATEVAVLEMGMYARGEIALLASIARPEVGVVTNVGPIHLERLGSIEGIAEAKAELVEALPSDGVAILNGDDRRVAAMAERTEARALLYGEGPACHVRGSDLRTRGLAGITFRISYEGGTTEVATRVPGRVGMMNCLAAAAAGLAFGMPLDE
ncbi:MAG TPA: UDP-N-acetylmuramoyl-tripeptide--D-alanyl-D-alanine ligase, partial [Dehalococcoidia bacterium]|nr:UDP-N-acetylmuramoyl-tripeptide--D-alanyl-D-alanine ligase [Dehalococcoidia bacterium]